MTVTVSTTLKVHSSVGLSALMLITSTAFHYPNFSLSQMKFHTHEATHPPASHRQPLRTTTLLSISMNLALLGTSCKWNHAAFVLL